MSNINFICKRIYLNVYHFKFVGWGTIYFGGPTSPKLLEVNVRVWDQKTCAANYGRLNRKVSDTMLCAGESGRDACQVNILKLFWKCIRIT